MSEPITRGVHHVGLTVPDVEATARFFEEVLGFDRVGGRPEYPAVFVSDGAVMLTLWRATSPEDAVPFDRKRNIGLHHLALRVADAAALDDAYARLRAAGAEIELAPEPLGAAGARHLMAYAPGGIRLELTAPPLSTG